MRIKTYILFAAALALAACKSPSPEEPAPGVYEFTLQAAAGDPETRTLYEGDKTFSWIEGDEISVLFHSGSDNKFFTLTAQSGGSSATFKGLITNGYTIGSSDTGQKWALYPAASHTYAAKPSTGTYAHDQIVWFNQPETVDLTSGFSANIPLAALGSDSGSFVFKPACSVAKFSFSGIEASTVSFTVTSQTTHALSGLFPCKEGGYYLFWNPQYADPGTNSIKFIENVSDGKAVFYVPFPGWGASGFQPILSLKDNATGKTIYSATAKKGLPADATSSLGQIVVFPDIKCDGSQGGGEQGDDDLTTVTYEESTENFVNPERGYYKAHGFKSASDSPVSTSKMRSYRYSGTSLVLLEFFLMDYVTSDISQSYLTLIENNFKNLRSGGMKCVLRFAYSDGHSSSDHPWDATEDWVLRHIAQLKPLLQSYSDVIFVLQAGFIGSWGEWYYTDYLSDYQTRKRILEALLDAMPADREVSLRTPNFKIRLLGASSSNVITAATAHDGSDFSRVGGHNDCFVASSSDQGTFNSNTERTIWKADSKYTIMGGETCAISDYCHCDAYSGHPGALSELASYHYSYLNSGYHEGVHNLWKSEGCEDEIGKLLGYRLVLTQGSFTAEPKAGGQMKVVLKLQNKGFAAPMNPRGAYLVLTNASGTELARWPLGSDPRTWHPEEGLITVEQSVTLPSSASGDLELHLDLPDGRSNLASNPYFSIRLANEDVWSERTGFNLLYSFTL